MKTLSITPLAKDSAHPAPQCRPTFCHRCQIHLICDLLPTLLILTLVAGGALLGARLLHQTRNAPFDTPTEFSQLFTREG